MDIWKIGQKISADDFYKNSNFIMGTGIFINEVQRAKNITKICEGMSETYDQIINEQNDYVIEINDQLNEISQLQEKLEAEVLQKEKERDKILGNAGDEGLTDEERSQVESLDSEINSLNSDTNTQIDNINNNIEKTSTARENNTSKAEIATDYANKAIEKGQPLSEMQDKRKSFWRKAFGGWDKSAEREAGKAAVNAGNNLLEQVETSQDIEKEISKKTKIKKTK